MAIGLQENTAAVTIKKQNHNEAKYKQINQFVNSNRRRRKGMGLQKRKGEMRITAQKGLNPESQHHDLCSVGHR